MARNKGSRTLSYTEISTALTCQARWDFSYGGHLIGSTLKERSVSQTLSDGRAWGAAVAAWHAGYGSLTAANDAHLALASSIARDASEMRERGVDLPDWKVIEQRSRLRAILDHYISTAEQLPGLTLLEGEFVAPIPSRGGRRASNLYRFLNLIDGYTSIEGRQWIVEFKLRGKLHPHWLIAMLRQYLWYSWSLGRAQGFMPAGIIIDERLNDLPNEPRIVNAKRKGEGRDGKIVSESADQRTTVDQYVAACREYGQEPSEKVVAALEAIRWQHRVHLPFDPDELELAGRELVSAAQLIGQLDSGKLYPIRNTSPMTCNGCRFKDICPDPTPFVVDGQFVRTVPKRLRDVPADETTTTQEVAY